MVPSTPHGVIALVWTLALGSSADFEISNVEGYASGRERMSPRVVILVVHVFVTFSHTTPIIPLMKFKIYNILNLKFRLVI